MDDSRIFAHLLLDQFEARIGTSASFWWQAEGWAGSDENRVYLLTEGQAARGAVNDAQHELLYDRPLTTYFDVRAGVRSDLDGARARSWAALGIAGMAPYFVRLSGTVYASDGGHYAAQGTAACDLLLTQRWILTPAVELNAYSRPERGRQTGSGLAGIEAGMRLRYEFSHKFAPYVGVSYERDVTAVGGASATRVALGLRAWL